MCQVLFPMTSGLHISSLSTLQVVMPKNETQLLYISFSSESINLPQRRPKSPHYFTKKRNIKCHVIESIVHGGNELDWVSKSNSSSLKIARYLKSTAFSTLHLIEHDMLARALQRSQASNGNLSLSAALAWIFIKSSNVLHACLAPCGVSKRQTEPYGALRHSLDRALHPTNQGLRSPTASSFKQTLVSYTVLHRVHYSSCGSNIPLSWTTS